MRIKMERTAMKTAEKVKGDPEWVNERQEQVS